MFDQTTIEVISFYLQEAPTQIRAEITEKSPIIYSGLLDQIEQAKIKLVVKQNELATKINDKITLKQAELQQKTSELNTKIRENTSLASSEYTTNMNAYKESKKDKYLSRATERQARYLGRAADANSRLEEVSIELTREINQLQILLIREEKELKFKYKNIISGLETTLENFEIYLENLIIHEIKKSSFTPAEEIGRAHV